MASTRQNREIRSLVDRLARMDATRPRQDRAAVEQAIRTYLKGIGPRRRRVVWVEDAHSGFRRVAGQAHAGGLPTAALIRIDYMWYLFRFLILISLCGGLGTFAASAPLGFLASWLVGDKVGLVVRGQIGPPTFTSGAVAVTLVSTFYLALVLLFVRNMRRRRAVVQPIEAALSLLQPHWDAATLAATGGESSEVLVADFWHHVRNCVPFAAHQEAHGEVFGPSTRHITGCRACPMSEAFASGLFLYWIRPREVVCVPQPALHMIDGQLHREDGPAVEWATGEGYWFRRGAAFVPPTSPD